MDSPVVLVHRAGGVAAEWDDVRSILETRDPGRTFLAVDLPGRGGSGVHPGSMERLAEWVVERVVELGQGPAVLAGHSMGGALCLQAALQFAGWVKGIVLVASGPELRLARELLRVIERGEVLADPEFAGQMLSPSLPAARRREMMLRMGAVPASVLKADLEAAWKLDLRERLGEVRAPVRIVAGRDDRLISTRKATILRDSLPGSSLRVVGDAGHMLVWEAAQAVAEEILAMVNDAA